MVVSYAGESIVTQNAHKVANNIQSIDNLSKGPHGARFEIDGLQSVTALTDNSGSPYPTIWGTVAMQSSTLYKGLFLWRKALDMGSGKGVTLVIEDSPTTFGSTYFQLDEPGTYRVHCMLSISSPQTFERANYRLKVVHRPYTLSSDGTYTHTPSTSGVVVDINGNSVETDADNVYEKFFPSQSQLNQLDIDVYVVAQSPKDRVQIFVRGHDGIAGSTGSAFTLYGQTAKNGTSLTITKVS